MGITEKKMETTLMAYIGVILGIYRVRGLKSRRPRVDKAIPASQVQSFPPPMILILYMGISQN